MKITGYKDYIQKVYDEFPDIDEASIRSVVRHGLGMLMFFRVRDHDVYISNPKTNHYYYFGDTTHSQEERYEIMNKKLRRKIRVMSALRKEPFDGNYTFGLTDEEWEASKTSPIMQVRLYRVKRECHLYRKYTRFFTVHMDMRSWYKVIDDFDINKATIIE